MKSEIKKVAAIIAATVMSFSMYSCGSASNEKKDSSEKAEVTTTVISTESEEVSDSNSELNALNTNVSDSETEEEDIDPDSLKYDFKGLKTEKYINIFTDGRYKMVGTAEETAGNQEAFIDVKQNKMLLNIDYLGQKFSMLIDNGKQYTILGKTYFKAEEEGNMMESVDPFKNCGYLKSGEKDIDGTTYYFDEYYNVELSSSIKIIVDKDGNLYGIDSEDTVTEIKELATDFDDSVFNVLEGCQETTQEEFFNSLMGSAGDQTPAE